MFNFENLPLNQAAEFHFYIRKQIVNNLKATGFSPEVRKALNTTHDNYHDQWVGQFGDHFLDMTTMIRIGTAIEGELRATYMRLQHLENLVELHSAPSFKPGIFQRIMPWQHDDNSAISLFEKIEIDLGDVVNIREAREVMAHRHLYAHSMGLVDEKYITDWTNLSGEDITPELIPHNYPEEDCFWFRPLQNLTQYIVSVQNFVKDLKRF